MGGIWRFWRFRRILVLIISGPCADILDLEFAVRRGIGSSSDCHFGPQSGENGSKMAIGGLGGSKCPDCRRGGPPAGRNASFGLVSDGGKCVVARLQTLKICHRSRMAIFAMFWPVWKLEFVVRMDILSTFGCHFGPRSGENGSKMAIDGLGGLGYQSRCRRAVLYIVSEVVAQTGSRFEKPEVVFLVQEIDRNARICAVAGLRRQQMPN